MMVVIFCPKKIKKRMMVVVEFSVIFLPIADLWKLIQLKPQ